MRTGMVVREVAFSVKEATPELFGVASPLDESVLPSISTYHDGMSSPSVATVPPVVSPARVRVKAASPPGAPLSARLTTSSLAAPGVVEFVSSRVKAAAEPVRPLVLSVSAFRAMEAASASSSSIVMVTVW